jgi:biopolymer transport protein TolQ
MQGIQVQAGVGPAGNMSVGLVESNLSMGQTMGGLPVTGGVPEFDFWHMVSNATWVVQGVLVLLVLMSLISWSIIFFKIVQLNLYRIRTMRERELFLGAANLADGVQSLREQAGSCLYPVAKLGVAELKRLEKSTIHPNLKFRVAGENLQRTLQQGVQGVITELSRTMAFLATCANASPFIGLFGTVWGILNSFHAIGQMKTAALAAVAPGISEALVATAIGLGVAIPASLAYNTFTGMLGTIQSHMEHFSVDFLNRAQLELPWLGKRES